MIQVTGALESRYPQILFITDVQQIPGDEVPPLIDGFRPDVYGRKISVNSIVIAEAKTDGDLDNKHTHNQIKSFIDYLERKENGFFVLSINSHSANRAKTLLRFIRQGMDVRSTKITVFDGCDFWLLDSTGRKIWHLD